MFLSEEKAIKIQETCLNHNQPVGGNSQSTRSTIKVFAVLRACVEIIIIMVSMGKKKTPWL